jgi:signal transduction histidine kinase
VIDVVRSRLKKNLEEKHITITSKVGDASLRADQHDLETIIYNLVHNAIKFSPADTEIVISSSENQLIVNDQGYGIESKHLPHIFERFYKADDARSLNTSSNGLGLALVAEIVYSYGGTISVESEVGKGTVFTVKFS